MVPRPRSLPVGAPRDPFCGHGPLAVSDSPSRSRRMPGMKRCTAARAAAGRPAVNQAEAVAEAHMAGGDRVNVASRVAASGSDQAANHRRRHRRRRQTLPTPRGCRTATAGSAALDVLVAHGGFRERMHQVQAGRPAAFGLETDGAQRGLGGAGRPRGIAVGERDAPWRQHVGHFARHLDAAGMPDEHAAADRGSMVDPLPHHEAQRSLSLRTGHTVSGSASITTLRSEAVKECAVGHDGFCFGRRRRLGRGPRRVWSNSASTLRRHKA